MVQESYVIDKVIHAIFVFLLGCLLNVLPQPLLQVRHGRQDYADETEQGAGCLKAGQDKQDSLALDHIIRHYWKRLMEERDTQYTAVIRMSQMGVFGAFFTPNVPYSDKKILVSMDNIMIYQN